MTTLNLQGPFCRVETQKQHVTSAYNAKLMLPTSNCLQLFLYSTPVFNHALNTGIEYK